MMKWFPVTFQNLENKQMFIIDWLHDYILILLFFVLVLVGGILISLKENKFINSSVSEIPILEFVWTAIPGMILVLIGVPSLSILYSFEATNYPDLTLKVTGHQWYWSYDYSDFSFLEFDSYLKPMEDLMKGEPRLLETDNHVVLPLMSSVRVVISSSDVLHSWAMPALGIKADANPGRMNLLYINSLDTCGLFYGQCSEICGANHSFMPICLETVPFISFNLWMKTFE